MTFLGPNGPQNTKNVKITNILNTTVSLFVFQRSGDVEKMRQNEATGEHFYKGTY